MAERSKLRLLYLSKILENETDEERGLTMNELLDRLAGFDIEAERKSVGRDIKSLQEAGMDIRLKGSPSCRTYHLCSRLFELSEIKMLVDIISASKFLSEEETEHMVSGLEKLVSARRRSELNHSIYIYDRAKNENEQVFTSVDRISQSMNLKQKVAFRYFDWRRQGETHYRKKGRYYIVTPRFLCWEEEHYYMVAYDSEAGMLKHYRVDRMTEVTVSEEAAEPEAEEINIAEYVRKNFHMFSGKLRKITLRVKPQLVGAMIDRFGSEVFMHPIPDSEDYLLTTEAAVSEQFAGWIFGFGDQVEVIEPESVRKFLGERAEKLAVRYRKKE
ncbi:MAG: WYL domain-containing protein [Lachnospiraceae bacterium]|nr:WYL domain-containing protein [Lachnospiraceae bacterium]